MSKILLIEDDEQTRKVLGLYLRRVGHQVFDAATLEAGRAERAKEPPDLTIVDYQLPDGTAFDLIEALGGQDSREAVILLTGVGTIDLAVRAIKAGAEHFLTKPVDLESLEVLVRRTLETQRAKRQQGLAQVSAEEHPDPFVGKSPAISRVREVAEAVVGSEAPVLILGETGTGKSVLAKWLHLGSPRQAEAFVDLNCAGLSHELVESELFGHRKGAFTGAVGNKPGLLEVAHRGTLFLDEIGDLELVVQPKLLKVLEQGTFRRVGDVATRSADVRLIAATHRNLQQMVKQDKFREDLLFRVNTLTFELPPLRERSLDLPDLARTLLTGIGKRKGRPKVELSPDALSLLQAYRWPGNIRELRNVLERALLFCKGDVLDRKSLHFDRSLDPEELPTTLPTLEEAERRHIQNVLRSVGGHAEKAAEVLDLSRSALYAKLKKFGIKPSGD